MKPKSYILLLLAMLLGVAGVEAQNTNRLVIPDMKVQIGEAKLPVRVENMDEIVAMQFDLTLPEGVTASTNVNMTDRCKNHQVTLRRMKGQAYRLMLYSTTQSTLDGQGGVVLYIPITIPTTKREGEELELTITDAVLSKRTGENVLTATELGKLTVANLPDLEVSSVNVDKTSLTPGDQLVASWQVSNVGNMPTTGGFSEQISLVSEDGTVNKLIATTHCDETINVNGVVSRQAEITLPALLGIDGQAHLQVRIVPDSDAGESDAAQGNNIQVNNSLITVNKLLTLILTPERIKENGGQRIALRVNRSGAWTVAQTFTISATADSRVSVPTSITIPANQSAAVTYFNVKDNTILDHDSIVSISVQGNGYAVATTSLIIDDNELPPLTVTPSKNDVNEGESFQLTIATGRASDVPLTVTLTSEKTRRFTFPQQVVIPAGSTSVTIDVVVVDNDEIELQEGIAFRVSAEGYEEGECIVLLNDNDMPTLTFTLSPEAVSESDGYAALLGVIKRTDNLDKRVTLKLSDDSNGLLTYTDQTIVMAKNQAEVQFNIGVTDNDQVDGNHVVNVTAAVYSSSCSCSVPDNSNGSMTATITILDDDGPSLKVKPAGTSMLEGSEGNVFVISHNINTDADVIVRISSDRDDLLTYDHELTIPAGQSSANLLVNVKSNDQEDDSNIVTFKVEADGYAMGTCWIVITDQTLPDAVISLSADKAEVEAEQTVLLRAVVKNVGNSTLRSSTPISISFSGRSEPVSLMVGKSVAVGDSAIVEYNYGLPAVTGRHTFVATINAAKKVPELLYSNNTSNKVSINILVPFRVTAQADKDVYKQNDDIVISGSASGSAGQNADIEVYIINEDARQTISATTNAEGKYTISWKPLSRQSGHFVVGACYPGANTTDEMDAFDVYGIKAGDNFKTCELSLTETISGKIIVTNPGLLNQTGVTITPKAESGTCEFSFNTPSSINAGKSVEIGYTIKGNALSEGRDWQQMPIEITTTEGGHIDYTIYYFVYPLKAKLEANKTTINTTMTFGTPREYPLTIKNIGKAETGKITLALPDWIQTVTPREMASLAQGDSTTIVLRFVPTDEMQLNVCVRGRLGINCANGDGIAIDFNITPVSEAKGRLIIDAVDEYTFFTAEAPHISNAKVYVKKPSTNEIVAEGLTGEDGTFSIEIPEGNYDITIEAEKHKSYSNTIVVDPGVDTKQEAFMSYQAITYSWNVVETEIEDENAIELVVQYETRVPKPVVVISLPKERPAVNGIIPVVVTNHGLVKALDFHLELSISDGYTLEYLNEPSLETLNPQQSYVFYAKLLDASSEESGSTANHVRRKAKGDNDCLSMKARGDNLDPCEKYKEREYTYAEGRWGDCDGNGGNGDGDGGNGGGHGGDNGGDNGGSGGGGGGGRGNGPGAPYVWDKHDVDTTNSPDPLGKPSKNCFDPSNPNDPNNPNAANDPVGLPLVPEGNGDNPPLDCDSKEDPVFAYKLVPLNGPRYEMKGVSADGVSQLKLVLDPILSKIPKDDCDRYFGFRWELLDSLGTIEGSSFKEAIYTAPDSFPNTTGSSVKILAIMRYKERRDPFPARDCSSEVVEIEIIRPPVVFVHGLNDTETLWQEMDRQLIQSGLYIEDINFRVDYTTTNTYSFKTNVPVIGLGIKKAQHRALCKGYAATKCDLVGHSMGGILSRLYVQNGGAYNTKEVNRIITVNTPHSGSEIADCIVEHKVLLGNIAREFFTFGQHQKGFDIEGNLGAINDLAVMSDAMIDLNVDLLQKPDVPVYSIATELKYSSELLQSMGNKAALALSVASIATSLATSPWYTPVIFAAATYGLHIVNEDFRQVGIGDFVVSTESQIGGCEKYSIIEESGEAKDLKNAMNVLNLYGIGALMSPNLLAQDLAGDVCSVAYSFVNEPWHCKSPKHKNVMDEIESLLSRNANDPVFSKSWFTPANRTFNHNFAWAIDVASNFFPSDFVKGLKAEGVDLHEALKLTKSDVGNALKVGIEGIGTGYSYGGLLKACWDYIKGSSNHAPRKMAPAQRSLDEDRFIRLNLNIPDGYSDPFVTFAFGKDVLLMGMGDDIEFKVPSTFSGETEISLFMKNENDSIIFEQYYYTIDEPLATPVSLALEETTLGVDENEPLRLYCTWNDGSVTKVVPDNVSFENSDVASFVDKYIVGQKVGRTKATATYMGLTCDGLIRVFDSDDNDNDDSPSICSTVTLSFKQKMVISRQAFRGTLTVNNGNPTTAMKDVKLNLEVRDMNNKLATSHEFAIDTESLKGFTGEKDFTSGWTLNGGETGVATILFIPTINAAPTEPQDYSFGGSFSYTDPNTGLTVTLPLNPVTLTVNPSPNLEMTYFMQRDVFGDDPQTEEVEPMIPSEFALLVNNKGYGDAKNVNLTTQQPEITDNQKQLAINFEIISTQLNGGEKTLALGGATTSDFGTIPAQSQAYAQWWLQSTLLGHFSKYNVKATHVTSHDNPDLSLLDTVLVRELIHGFTVGTDSEIPLRGFLVNDIDDNEDLPDEVYFTDATQQHIFIATGATMEQQSDSKYLLKVNSANAGWTYGSLLDPTHGKQKLVSITRADGTEVYDDNIWQTYRTLRDGKDPLNENRLHFVGNMSAGGETFYLTFEPKPEPELAVESFAGVPDKETVLREQLTEISVKFNKPVKVSTFTTDDIILTCQGAEQDATKIVIEQVGENEFKLLLNEATILDGFFVLTVQTADIEDMEGFTGSVGESAKWTQYVDGKVALKVLASPAEGGSVTPGSGRFDYDRDVTLTATPAEGYDFAGWSLNGENISSTNEFTYHLTAETELKALFTIKHYDVTIDYDASQGSVSGAATGIYDYGTLLQLTAEPNADFTFDYWVVDDYQVGSDGSMDRMVDKPLVVKARFKRNIFHQDITFNRGWNWVSTYTKEVQPLNLISAKSSRVLGQFDELVLDPEYGLVGGIDQIEPGAAYKVKALSYFTSTFDGHLYDLQASPLEVKKGWNWIAYPYFENNKVDVLQNAEEGDFIVAQTGFTEYADGYWQGSLENFNPGEGYMYKSSSDKSLDFNFTSNEAGVKSLIRRSRELPIAQSVNTHKYPNTMNVTARLSRDGQAVEGNDYIVYAMAGDELRGVSKCIGGLQYITIYGEQPVDISFVIVDAITYEMYEANETLKFRSDVVGSRKAPYTILMGNATGIDYTKENHPMTIYRIDGILLKKAATKQDMQQLPKGIYIINGNKCYVK